MLVRLVGLQVCSREVFGQSSFHPEPQAVDLEAKSLSVTRFTKLTILNIDLR